MNPKYVCRKKKKKKKKKRERERERERERGRNFLLPRSHVFPLLLPRSHVCYIHPHTGTQKVSV